MRIKDSHFKTAANHRGAFTNEDGCNQSAYSHCSIGLPVELGVSRIFEKYHEILTSEEAESRITFETFMQHRTLHKLTNIWWIPRFKRL